MQRLNFSWTGSTLRHVHTDPVSASILRPHGPYFNIYLEGVPIKSVPAAVGPQALEFVKLLVRAAAEDEASGAPGVDIMEDWKGFFRSIRDLVGDRYAIRQCFSE